MKLGLLILLMFSALQSLHAEAVEECHRKEIDPRTKLTYQNEAQWEADRRDLLKNAPEMPDLFKLSVGYRVGVAESANARRMRPDKRQHCYVGCRIANEAGHEVAVYAAYYKENKDLNDCNPKTHFDLKDIDATVAGADLALAHEGRADANYCATRCKESFPK